MNTVHCLYLYFMLHRKRGRRALIRRLKPLGPTLQSVHRAQKGDSVPRSMHLSTRVPVLTPSGLSRYEDMGNEP